MLLRARVVAGVAVLVASIVLVAIGVDLQPDELREDTDAVVILGGRLDRLPPGLALAGDLDAPLVLSSSAVTYAARFGVQCEDVAVCFRPVPETTAGEAANLRGLADRQGWEHLTVITSEFHAARARVLFRQCFDREAVSVISVPSQQPPHRWIISRVRERLAIVAAWTVARAC